MTTPDATTSPLAASAVVDARLGELLRLSVLLDGPDLALDDVRRYVAERLNRLYPLDYHVYRGRWQRLATGERAGAAPGPLLAYLEWRALVIELEDEVGLAAMLEEGATARERELRELLLL